MNTWFIEMPDCFKMKNLWEKIVKEILWMLEYVPKLFKTQEICKNAFEIDPDVIQYIPDCFKTQDMWERVLKEEADIPGYFFALLPDQFKTQDTCNNTVFEDVVPLLITHVPAWFVTAKMLGKNGLKHTTAIKLRSL